MPGGCGFSQVLLEEVTNFCGVPASILELGCGNGGNLSAFPAESTKVGIDPLADNIHTAEKRKLPNAVFVCANHEFLTVYQSNSIDVGVTLSVLDHIGDVAAVEWTLHQMARICRHLVLIEPYEAGTERQFVRGENKFYRNTWLHDYKLILGRVLAGYHISQFTIEPKPLYDKNSGPYYHVIKVDCL
jgi:SAM-dependent methyltransferase